MSEGAVALGKIELKRADVMSMLRDDVVLRGSPLLKAITNLDAALQFCVARRYRPQATIFKQGDVGDSLYMILKGHVRLQVLAGADSVAMEPARAGDLVGESEALVGRTARAYSALAQGDCDVLEMPRVVLLDKGQLRAAVTPVLESFKKRRTEEAQSLSSFIDRW